MLGFQPNLGARWETLGAVTASSRGTVLTASATANTKGTGVSLGTPGFLYRQIAIVAHNASAAADYVFDLYVGDPAGAGWLLCPDLRLPALAALNYGGVCYNLPLIVASGTALFARCASSTASATMAVAVMGCSIGPQGTPGFSRLVSLYTPSLSKGFDFNCGAVSNTDAGYSQISAGVGQRIGGIVVTLGGEVAGGNNYYLRIGTGATGNQVVVMGGMFCESGGGASATSATPYVHGPDGCDAPPSQPWWVDGQASATGRHIDVALHGLVV